MYCRRLIASWAFSGLTWGAEGMMMEFLSTVNEIEAKASLVPTDVRGKYLCYFGINRLVIGKTESGIHCLQEALSLLNNSPEQTILRVVVFHILAVYYHFQNNPLTSSQFYSKALQACRAAGDMQLLVIPATEMATAQTNRNITLLNKPLQLQVIHPVKKASEHFSHLDIDMFLRNVLLTTINEVEIALSNGTPGLFYFHQVAVSMLGDFRMSKHTGKLAVERMGHHQTALEQCKKRFGEEHPSTADSYDELGFSQHEVGDVTSALCSKRRALDIRRKLFGEDHLSTADSYQKLGITQNRLGDFSSAIQSHQRSLDIRLNLFGEDHPSTADSYHELAHNYHELGVFRYSVGVFSSALQCAQRALHIRRKLFGEDHSRQ